MRPRYLPILSVPVCSLLLAALSQAAPLVGRLTGANPAGLVAAQGIVMFVWVVLVVAVVRGIAGLRLSFGANLGALVVCVAVWAFAGKYLGGLEPLRSIALIWAAAFLGCVVAVIFREPNIMLPVALLAPLVDYWTVAFGPVRQVIEGSPRVLEQVSASLPAAHPVLPVYLIGAGDFLFMGMFLAAAERLDMSPGRTAGWFAGLVTAGMLMVMSGRGFEDGVPGLVAIGLGFVIANWRHFKLSKSEIAITAAVMGLAVAAIILASRRQGGG